MEAWYSGIDCKIATTVRLEDLSLNDKLDIFCDLGRQLAIWESLSGQPDAMKEINEQIALLRAVARGKRGAKT